MKIDLENYLIFILLRQTFNFPYAKTSHVFLSNSLRFFHYFINLMSADNENSNQMKFESPRILTPEEEEMLKKQKEIKPFKKNKLEIDAKRNWDLFYKRNGTNFFKDRLVLELPTYRFYFRHWSNREFQEIFVDVNLKV